MGLSRGLPHHGPHAAPHTATGTSGRCSPIRPLQPHEILRGRPRWRERTSDPPRHFGDRQVGGALQHRPGVGLPCRPHADPIAVARMLLYQRCWRQHVGGPASRAPRGYMQRRARETFVLAPSRRVEVRSHGGQVDGWAFVQLCQARESAVVRVPVRNGSPTGAHPLGRMQPRTTHQTVSVDVGRVD